MLTIMLATRTFITIPMSDAIIIPDAIILMRLLQLASSTLPVGAYSYSEGLEYLVDRGKVDGPDRLHHWLIQELSCGAIRVEAAVLVRAYEAIATQNLDALWYWNNWLSAARETEELRCQSWQMGQSLMRLLTSLQPGSDFSFTHNQTCNFAIAFAIAAANWQIDRHTAAIAYLYSWASNLVGAGIKLIPLGQTIGQQMLGDLQPQIANTAQQVIQLDDDDLEACTWGLSLASMAHETQYTRLFRS